MDDYWQRLKGSRGELQELIEVVVVPETWFSRDREAFAELTRVAREEWRPSRPAAVRQAPERAVLDRRGTLLDGDGACSTPTSRPTAS